VPLWTTRRSSRALVQKLGSHDGPIAALAVLPDGRVVSSGAWDGRLRIWDPASSRADPVELTSPDGNILALAALPDGRVVLGCAIPQESLELPDRSVFLKGSIRGDPFRGRVLVWNPGTPQARPVELGRHDGGVLTLAVLPDGRVASGSEQLQGVFQKPEGGFVTGDVFEGRVRVWNPAAPGAAPVASLGYDSFHLGYGSVRALAVLLDGRIVTGAGSVIRVWDPARPGARPLELGDAGSSARAVVTLPDGRVVSGAGMDVSGGPSGRLQIWDPAKPDAGPVELGCTNCQVQALAVLPDGRVVSGCIDRRLRIWDPAAPRGAAPVDLGSHDDWVEALAVLPGGKVVSGGAEGKLLVWDPGLSRRRVA